MGDHRYLPNLYIHFRTNGVIVMSKETLYNEDCKLVLADELAKEKGTRHVYLEKPNGAIKCIGTLMGTIPLFVEESPELLARRRRIGNLLDAYFTTRQEYKDG